MRETCLAAFLLARLPRGVAISQVDAMPSPIPAANHAAYCHLFITTSSDQFIALAIRCASTSDRSSALDELDYQRDDCQKQQQVDESVQSVCSNHSQQPQHEQNCK
jgi:hypothetical protein